MKIEDLNEDEREQLARSAAILGISEEDLLDRLPEIASRIAEDFEPFLESMHQAAETLTKAFSEWYENLPEEARQDLHRYLDDESVLYGQPSPTQFWSLPSWPNGQLSWRLPSGVEVTINVADDDSTFAADLSRSIQAAINRGELRTAEDIATFARSFASRWARYGIDPLQVGVSDTIERPSDADPS